MSKWNDDEYDEIISNIITYLISKYTSNEDNFVFDEIEKKFNSIKDSQNIKEKERLIILSKNEGEMNKFFLEKKVKLKTPDPTKMPPPPDPKTPPSDPINEQRFLEDIILEFINGFFKKYEIIVNLSKQNPRNDQEIAEKIKELKNEYGTDILKNKETISKGIITFPNRENRNKLRPILFKKIDNYKKYKISKTQIESLYLFKESLKQELNQFIQFLQRMINIKIGKNTSLKMVREAVNKYRKNNLFVSEILGDLEDLEKNGIKINLNYKKEIKLIEEEQKKKYYKQFDIYQSVLLNPVKNNTDFPEVSNFIKNLNDIYLRLDRIKSKIMSQYKPEAKPEVRSNGKSNTKPEAKAKNRSETKPEAKPKNKSETKSETKTEAKSNFKSKPAERKSKQKHYENREMTNHPKEESKSHLVESKKKKRERKKKIRDESFENDSYHQIHQRRERKQKHQQPKHDHHHHQGRKQNYHRPRQDFLYFGDLNNSSYDNRSSRKRKNKEPHRHSKEKHHRKEEKKHHQQPQKKEVLPNSHFELPPKKDSPTNQPKKNQTIKFNQLSKNEKILYLNTYLLYLFKDQIKNYKKIKLTQNELRNIDKSKKMIPIILKDKNIKVKLNKIIVQSIIHIIKDKYLSFVILESLTGKKYKFTSSLSKEEKSTLLQKYNTLMEDDNYLYLFINSILTKSKSSIV